MKCWLMLTALAVTCIFKTDALLNLLNPLKIHDTIDESLIKSILTAQEVVGSPIKEGEITYYLFKNGQANHTSFTFDDPTIAVNEEGNLYILIHGWFESRKVDWYQNLTEALLKRDPTAHVIQIDWSGPAKTKSYAFAVFNTEEVGREVANLIHKLVKRCKQPLENIVVIGHDLGGQVAGCAAKGYKVLSKRLKRIPRIIALDPAGGLFMNRPDDKRLNKEDADHVIVIHTDGMWQGYIAECGTLDFFPNGGITQPGCIGLVPLSCSHRRSWQYFIEAVSDPTSFPAKKCTGWFLNGPTGCGSKPVEETMGNALTTTKTGKFYLKTNSKSPFSKSLK